MKRYLILIMVSISILFIHNAFCANSQSSGNYYEYATVDTAPGANGYFTNTVYPRTERKDSQFKEIFFSVGGTGSMTVTLQFKRTDVDSDWSDYDTYTSSTFQKLEESSVNVGWRAVVKNGEYSSGSLTFGFSW